MAIERYIVDGRLDSSFSDDGRVTVGFADTNVAFALDVAIQADGRIRGGCYKPGEKPARKEIS